MASLDSLDLLARLRFQLRRPTSDESLTDAQAYQLLTDAQAELIQDVTSAGAGMLLLNTPTLMTTSDNKVFTFGTDADGLPIVPMGKVGIYPSLSAVPDYPLMEGLEFLNEGKQIRIPNDRTYTGPLYWRGVSEPAPISATSAPTIGVPEGRRLLVWKAAELYATLGDLRDATTYAAKYQTGLLKLLYRLKTEFGPHGALTGLTGLRRAMRS
jgi:hypothetical protein